MLDKRYARVIRWINRAQSMSADGNYSDAILDVECARAELDDARQELLLCHKNGEQYKRAKKIVPVSLAACFAVLFFVTPLQSPRIMPKQFLQNEAERHEIKVSASTSLLQENSFALLSDAPAVKPYELNAAAIPTDSMSESEGGVEPTGLASQESLGASQETQTVVLQDIHGDTLLASSQKLKSDQLSERDVLRLVAVGRKALRNGGRTVVLEFN